MITYLIKYEKFDKCKVWKKINHHHDAYLSGVYNVFNVYILF